MTSSPPVKPASIGGTWESAPSRRRILGTIAVVSVRHGGWPFSLIIFMAVALLATEWGVMSTPATPIRTSVAVSLAVLAGLVVAHLYGSRYGVVALVAVTCLATLALRSVTRRIGDVAFGSIYIGLPTLALVWLRQGDQGLGWTVLLFAVTWSADIGAFLVGSILKGPKLRPAFSPNKTWSGFAGGLAAATLAGVLADMGMGLRISPGWALGVGFVAGFATMAGDLWESWLKRRFGVKDSGDLILGTAACSTAWTDCCSPSWRWPPRAGCQREASEHDPAAAGDGPGLHRLHRSLYARRSGAGHRGGIRRGRNGGADGRPERGAAGRSGAPLAAAKSGDRRRVAPGSLRLGWRALIPAWKAVAGRRRAGAAALRRRKGEWPRSLGTAGWLRPWRLRATERPWRWQHGSERLRGPPALMQAARGQRGRAIIPVDSEHSAIFQALQGNPASTVAKLVLTASGGPFRTRSLEDMAGHARTGRGPSETGAWA
jgi:phosphatidate cytidylyltransferase